VSEVNEDANVSSRTIGIEIVNATGPYPARQLNATMALLYRVAHGGTAFPSIVPWNVVGHSDVATDDSGKFEEQRPALLPVFSDGVRLDELAHCR
jgi:N-acetyl-anhydromuramyl-L-alanine amidase AmpD